MFVIYRSIEKNINYLCNADLYRFPANFLNFYTANYYLNY